MAAGSVKVKFWGSRAQVAMPGKGSLKYGGNTACIQLIDDKNLMIIDSGFGINNLGETLFTKFPLTTHIFYTQFSWDHTQGLPFFLPIYFAQNTINLYSPHSAEELRKQLDVLFDSNYSPFEGLASMPANIRCHQLQQGQDINGVKINFAAVDRGSVFANQTKLKSHAYKFTFNSQAVTIVTNHEAKNNAINKDVIKLGENSDLLIHDAFYLHKNQSTYGLGHATAENALKNALAMNAAQCVLNNHSPMNDDKAIEAKLQELKKLPEFAELDFAFAEEIIEYIVKTVTIRAKAG